MLTKRLDHESDKLPKLAPKGYSEGAQFNQHRLASALFSRSQHKRKAVQHSIKRLSKEVFVRNS